MDRSRGEKYEILRADHGLLALYLHFRFPLEYEEGLLEIRMDMRVGLASVFEFPEDDFHAIRTRGTRTDKPAIGGSGMAGGRIDGQFTGMDNVFFHPFHPLSTLVLGREIARIGTPFRAQEEIMPYDRFACQLVNGACPPLAFEEGTFIREKPGREWN